MTTPPIDQTDVSRTVFDNDDEPAIIDSNGTKYLCGVDKHGWFSIVHVELTDDAPDDSEHDFIAWPVGEYPTTSFDYHGATALYAALEDYI